MQTHHIPENWKIEKRGDSYAVWDETGKARCGSLCRNGRPCGQPPMIGKFRCRIHRGTTVIGPEHHSYKDGKRSRYFAALPQRLQSRYVQLLESGEINDLSENVHLLDLRLTELANRIEMGEFGASYVALRRIHTDARELMNTALRGNNPEERAEALAAFVAMFNDMGKLIQTGEKDYQIWQQILDVNAERRATIKTISDIEHRGENSIPVSQIPALFFQLEQVFRRANLNDSAEERAKAFATGIHGLLNSG